MERKAHNSFYEAALQVQSGITPEPEINEAVLEYFNNYFGDNLNEDTSDEDIMNAVYDLIDLTEAVCDVVGLYEASVPKRIPRVATKKDFEGKGGKDQTGVPGFLQKWKQEDPLADTGPVMATAKRMGRSKDRKTGKWKLVPTAQSF